MKRIADGQEVHIKVSGSACRSMVALVAIVGVVVESSEKAIRVRVDNARRHPKQDCPMIWLPRSAVVEPTPPKDAQLRAYWDKNKVGEGRHELAKWFRFDAYQASVVNRIDAAIVGI